MDGCRHRRDFDQMIDAGDLTAATPMADIPYIGPFFSARLRRLGFATVNDLVLYFNRRPALFIYNGLSILLQNPRRNQCLEDDYHDDYHVADFNVCAFASLRNLLRVLHERRGGWRDLGFARKPAFPGPLGEAIPAQGGARAWAKAAAAATGPAGGLTAFAPPVSALGSLEWPIGRGNGRIDRGDLPRAFVTTAGGGDPVERR